MNKVTYSRTVKTSQNYNSEATSISLELEFEGTPDAAYAQAKAYVDGKLASLETQKAVTKVFVTGQTQPPQQTNYQQSNGNDPVATRPQMGKVFAMYNAAGLPKEGFSDWTLQHGGGRYSWKTNKTNIKKSGINRMIKMLESSATQGPPDQDPNDLPF
jgi:hypothetical protein